MTLLGEAAGGGFARRPEYDLELNPEFPGSGEQQLTVFGEARDVACVLAITPADGATWWAEIRGGSVVGVRPTPNPRIVCVQGDSSALLIDTVTREQVGDDMWPVEQVFDAVDAELLLIVDYSSVTAVGDEGIKWKSPPIDVYGMSITAADSDYIELEGGYEYGPPPHTRYRLDVATGQEVEETELRRVEPLWVPLKRARRKWWAPWSRG